MLKASVCTIGDEILIGQIVDTNKSFISSSLNSIGVKVSSHFSTGDDEDSIEKTILYALEFNDIVIVTGGLGPTKDDITKKVLAKLSGSSKMVFNNEQADIIKSICEKRGIELSQLNRDQALVPENCTVIPNKLGTAPCMKFSVENRFIYSLPGVPYEMQFLMDEVINDISLIPGCEKIIHHSVNTFGIPESELATKIAKWEDSLPAGIKLAYLPNPARGVKLRLSVYDGDESVNKQTINILFRGLKEILGRSIYGEGDDTLESVIFRELLRRGESISLAESCTGGNIGRIFTSIPGSSAIFKGGVVAYDNSAKTDILKVDPNIIKLYGAVSEECVKAMASGARRLFNSDWSLATSGIAGPEGGTDEKPVGTIWIAIEGPGVSITKKYIYSGDRERNIIRFSSGAINELRNSLNIEFLP